MLKLLEYPETSAYKVSRIFREKEDSLVALMHRADGSRFVCRIYDHPVPGYQVTGELAIPQFPTTYQYRSENGLCVVEEEFVDGISLTELMEVYRPDMSQTAAIGAWVCCALQALHEKGIVHRDVKPDNVLITSEGRVALTDLDASSRYDPEKERDTSLLGTAGYAAPEQFGFSRSDVRTDIFSLGVMLNVMLTGEHPSRKLAEGRIRPIIERCIEVNADKRFSSALELGKKLTELAGRDETCSCCGSVTPGGGCFCCGIPSEQKKTRGKRIPILVGVLCTAMLCSIFALEWIKGNETKDDETLSSVTQQAQAQAPQGATAPLGPGEKNVEEEDAERVEPDAEKAETDPEKTDPDVETTEISAEATEPDIAVYQGEFSFDRHMSKPFSVVIDGEEQAVHMAVDHCAWTYPQKSDSRSLVLNEGEYIELTYGIGFFRQIGEEEYSRISGDEEMDAVREKVGDSLKLEVLAYEDAGIALPEQSPELTEHFCSNGCFEGVTLQMGTENRGTYILRATALVEGEELISEFRVQWMPTSEICFTYDPAGGEMIDQINSFLAGVKYDEKYSVTVDIPAGSYEGEIVVPKMGLMYVRINGAQSAEGPATVLRGGVDGQSHRTHISNIRFEGAGVGLEEIPAQWPDGRENVAFYGTGGGACIGCEFEGYRAAIVSTGRLKMGTDNLFENNTAAFLIDTLYADGGSGMTGNEYRNNDIAIHFKTLNENWPTSWIEMGRSRFIDNKIDLRNDLGRSVTIADSYFADTINGAEVERECRVEQGEQQNT